MTPLRLLDARDRVAEPDPAPTAVPEHAVQRAWADGRFRQTGLATTDGEPVELLSLGRINRDSGPDIRDVCVRIGDLVWAGDVEIHRTSAEWRRHGHDRDPAYDRVVLHVVLAADGDTGTVTRHDGSRVPELVLLPHLTVSLARLVRDHHAPADGPPCAVGGRALPSPPDGWLEGLGTARLQARADAVAGQFGRVPDLPALLARRVFRALGYEANADAMETLADRADLATLRATDAPTRQALLLNDAGLAPSGLFEPALGVPMPAASWRRGGRPANAPRTRIAQAARLFEPGRLLGRDGLARSRELATVPELVDWLRVPPADHGQRLGRARAAAVVTNALLPVWLLDGEQRGDASVPAHVRRVARALPVRPDRVTRAYADAGIAAASALEALGVHQLADALCDEGRCARCALGRRLAPGLAR